MKKLFTFITAALTAMTCWAQFDEPELTKVTHVKIDGTTEYYMSVTNSEGDEYFYGKGNEWGTRTSAKIDPYDALVVRFHSNPVTVNGVMYTNTVKFNNYVSDKGGWNAFVDCDGGLQAWVDGQSRTGDGRWIISDLGNGRIQLANLNAPGGLFSFTPTRAQWSEDDQDYILVESQDDYGFDNRLWFVGARVDSVNILQYDEDGFPAVDEEGNNIVIGKRAAISYGDEVYSTWQLWDASLYKARMRFVDWYWNDMDEEGNTGTDICDMYPSVRKAAEEAQKVYDNPKATVEQLNAAYDAIIAAVGVVAVENNRDYLEGADSQNPIDLFAEGIAKNGSFDDGTLKGWTANLRGNSNQYMGHSYTNNDVSISGFAESWTGSASHSAGYGEFSQKVGLPAGLYILGVDMIATQQSSNKEGSKGVELFAKSEAQEFAIPVATGNIPEHFEVAFTAEDGTFTIGVRENNTTCNWIAVDNWTLKYYGNPTETLAQINLKTVIDEIAAKHDALSNIYGKTSVIEEYDNTFDAANELYEQYGLADEEYDAMADSLKKEFSKLEGTINDYNHFANLINIFNDRIEEVRAAGYEECAEELEDYKAIYDDQYDACEWGRDSINLVLAPISKTLGKYISTHVKNGDDVSILLTNPKFKENLEGWDIEGTSPWWAANHGQGANANADLCQETPEEENGLAECYHAVFDMSQTIYNVPAGLYTLSVQGFNRHDDGNMESAQLYAILADGKEQTQDFADIDAYKTADRLYVVGTLNEETGEIENIQWQSDAGRDGDTNWVPNGMSGSAWHFVNKSDGENYDYTNKFKILMKEAGDLKVGVRVKNAHQWVIFDNFTLTYEGAGAAVWVPTIKEEIEALDKECADAEITTGEYEAIQDVIEEAEAFVAKIEEATEDECAAMYDKLKAQHAEIPANIQLQADIQSFYDQLYSENIVAKAEEADAELAKRYEAICNIVDGDYDDLDNEGLKKAIQEIEDVIAALKMPKDWENASEENPADFSELIANRFFNVDGSEDPEYEPEAVQNHIFTEWQGKLFSTGGGSAANCGEVWNSGSAFNTYQQLSGLPEGYYMLSCQGFFRHGGGTQNSYGILYGEQEQTVYAYLYGNSSEGEYSTELCNIASVQLDEYDLDMLGIDISGGSSTFGNNYKAPDQLSSSDSFFKAGFYNNNVIVKVGADGKLRLGINKVGFVGQDWVVVDNFKLLYMGKKPVTPVDDQYPNGDVNLDKEVNIADFTTEVDIILETVKPSFAQRRQADVNKDGSINVGDLTSIVNIILGNEGYNPSDTIHYRARAFERNSMTAEYMGTVDGADRYAILLNNSSAIVGFQMDVEGNMVGQSLTSRANGQSIIKNDLRLLATGFGTKEFTGHDGAVMYIDIEKGSETTLSNIILSDAKGKTFEVENLVLSASATGLAGINVKSQAEYYNLNGVKTNGMQKGVQILRQANGSNIKVLKK